MTTLYQSINMSSEATTEPLRRDFRSSYYYKSLHGFKGGSGEKSLTHLEALIKMEVLGKLEISERSIDFQLWLVSHHSKLLEDGQPPRFSYLDLYSFTTDAEKLKVFCLQHTLPDYYRSFLWKILLGGFTCASVTEVFTNYNNIL